MKALLHRKMDFRVHDMGDDTPSGCRRRFNSVARLGWENVKEALVAALSIAPIRCRRDERQAIETSVRRDGGVRSLIA